MLTKVGILGVLSLIAVAPGSAFTSATSINLESDVSPTVYGQSVTFTATVSSGGGTPTGTVAFQIDGGGAIAATLNGSGKASLTISTLSVGSHSVSASYAGDVNFDPAFTSGFPHTVNQASTSTVTTQGTNATVFGETASFTATVTAQAPGAGTPTGTVTFVVDGTPQAPTALSGGIATLSVSNFAIGAHSVTATYNGDTNFRATVIGNIVLHSVTWANTTTTVSASPNPSNGGAVVTVTATVAVTSPGAGTPTGVVLFYDNGNLVGSSSVDGSGHATYTTNTFTVGTHSLTATYNGAANFVPSLSAGYSHTVNQAATTTSVSPGTNPSVVGQSVTLTATVTSSYAGTPTGTVSFYDGATLLGSGTLNGSAQATVTTSFTSAGSHSITAVYSSDSTYAPSTSSAATQTVNAAATTTTLVSGTNPSTYGQSVTFTATVTTTAPGSGSAAGTVNFFDGATLIGSATLNGSAQASLSTAALGAGSHSITAAYAGTSNFAASTSSATTQVVNQSATTTVLVSSANPSVFGQSVTFTATVSPVAPGAGTPTGSVQFKDGATVLSTVSLSGGTAAFSTSGLSVATHSITAVYAGDANFVTSTSGTVSQAVNKASTSAGTVSSVNPSVFGQSVTWTTTISVTAPGAGTPTGTVTATEGATTLGSASLSGGQAAISLGSLSVGSHSITFTYSGDGNFNGSSSSITQVVNQAATTTALTSSLNPSTFSNSVTFTATVNVTAPGVGTPTGTVTFRDGATALGTAALNGSRIATFTTTALTAGAHSITATYNADASFSGSASSTLTQTVSKANTTTVITPATSSVTAGDVVIFTATVTSSAGAPTGTVTFRDGSQVIGTFPLNGSGVATSGTVALNVGQHSVTATYNGDANFNTSTSSTASSVNVTPAQTSVSTPVLRSGNPVAGETLTLAATVTGDRRLTGVITFRDNNVVIGTAPIDSQGTAVISARLAVGPHAITATYEGDVQSSGSTSSPLYLTVRGAATVTLTSSANPSASGAPVTFTVAVASSTAGGPAATGTVTFTDGTRSLGSATLANGQASVTATDLTSGDHSIVAAYSGDTTYLAATSAALTQKVNGAASTTALEAGVDATGYYLLATVTGLQTGGAPSGNVTFEDTTANTTLGTATLANGSATVRLVAPLPVGHRLRAAYAGDTAYAGSNSATIPFIAGANAFSFAFTFADDSILSIFGADLAESTVTASSLPLPTTLGGVSVKIVDSTGASHNAPIYFVSAGQVNIVVPGDVPAGPARIVVTNSRGTFAISIVVVKSAPSLASGDGSGSGPAAAHLLRVHADGTQDPLVVVTSGAVPFGSQTDSLYLILYGTGFRNAQGSTTCSLNGQSVTALYAGSHSTYPGLDQLNLQVPGSLRGAGRVTVSCTVAGQTSNAVTINVQ